MSTTPETNIILNGNCDWKIKKKIKRNLKKKAVTTNSEEH